jgi:hypothetical protein
LKIGYLPNNFITQLKASERIRTPDPLITNQLLYQLSYAGAIFPLQALKLLLYRE